MMRKLTQRYPGDTMNQKDGRTLLNLINQLYCRGLDFIRNSKISKIALYKGVINHNYFPFIYCCKLHLPLDKFILTFIINIFKHARRAEEFHSDNTLHPVPPKFSKYDFIYTLSHI